jgi:hypothetical protein
MLTLRPTTLDHEKSHLARKIHEELAGADQTVEIV